MCNIIFAKEKKEKNFSASNGIFFLFTILLEKQDSST